MFCFRMASRYSCKLVFKRRLACLLNTHPTTLESGLATSFCNFMAETQEYLPVDKVTTRLGGICQLEFLCVGSKPLRDDGLLLMAINMFLKAWWMGVGAAFDQDLFVATTADMDVIWE